jgi:hypothetical protein
VAERPRARRGGAARGARCAAPRHPAPLQTRPRRRGRPCALPPKARLEAELRASAQQASIGAATAGGPPGPPTADGRAPQGSATQQAAAATGEGGEESSALTAGRLRAGTHTAVAAAQSGRSPAAAALAATTGQTPWLSGGRATAAAGPPMERLLGGVDAFLRQLMPALASLQAAPDDAPDGA